MKTSILTALVLFSLVACKKEEKVLPKAIAAPSTSTTVSKSNQDTIPDKAAFKIKLAKDSTNSDETMLSFNHKVSRNYSANNDAPYFQGFGQVSLASISGNGVDLAINELPYTPGMSIGLDVHAKTDGAYFLAVSYQNKMPANIQIWLKDTYLKDSVNVGAKSYTFKVAKADTNSFGKNRFRIIFKDINQ